MKTVSSKPLDNSLDESKAESNIVTDIIDMLVEDRPATETWIQIKDKLSKKDDIKQLYRFDEKDLFSLFHQKYEAYLEKNKEIIRPGWKLNEAFNDLVYFFKQ